MRRAKDLVTIDRREFNGGVAACLGLALAASCTDTGGSVVETGPLGGNPGNPDSPDAGVTHMPDASMGSNGSGSNGSGSGSGSGSSGPQPTCPSSGVTDVGAPSSFVAGTPVYNSTGKFFVVRDSGGLYALTSACTHEGATCTTQSGHFYCPRHGATFSFNGDPLSGPVITGLVHYAMCTLANGHVGVVKSQQVSQSARLVA